MGTKDVEDLDPLKINRLKQGMDRHLSSMMTKHDPRSAIQNKKFKYGKNELGQENFHQRGKSGPQVSVTAFDQSGTGSGLQPLIMSKRTQSQIDAQKATTKKATKYKMFVSA